MDDTTSIERVDKRLTTKHFTTTTTQEHVPAPGTQLFLNAVVDKTEEIGMRVNCLKTQVLCVSPDNGCHSTAMINAGGIPIESTSSIKLLGFILDSNGGMSGQVGQIKKKFRGKFWSLLHLRSARISGRALFKIYVTFVRPTLECSCVVFHFQLTKTQSAELEALQKLVCRLCFGFNVPYSVALSNKNIETLWQLRENAIRRFAMKSRLNGRFGDRWFIPRDPLQTNLRNRKPYKETKARTEQYYRSPLLYMQRTVNNLLITNSLSITA